MNQNVGELPNRGHLTTEQRSPASAALDALSTEQALRMMNTQDMDAMVSMRKLARNVMSRTRLLRRNVKNTRRYQGRGFTGLILRIRYSVARRNETRRARQSGRGTVRRR